MKKVVLQREFYGQDCLGQQKFQVTIDDDYNLNYRETKGGNCEFGDWLDYEGEKRALEFIFGNLPLTKTFINEFKKVCLKADEVNENSSNMDNY